MTNPLLSIQNLSVNFKNGDIVTTAVKSISLEVNKGEIVALVGESGSGKSVTSLSVLQLLPSPPAITASGNILFNEEGEVEVNLIKTSRNELQQIRGNRISMIFQEPMTSLNPVFTCGSQVMETLRLHKNLSKAQAKQEAINWFEKVKLPDPAGIFNRYPHQLSGGQKQRVMIAMAMCCRPALLICDEPTTALDVMVQKNILELIKELQQETNMGVIFITHDLGVVAQIADRAAVMLKGEIVEQGSVNDIFYTPKHSYTKALLACRPVNHKRGERLLVVSDFLNADSAVRSVAVRDAHVSNHYAVARPPARLSHSGGDDQGGLASGDKDKPLIKVENLSVYFPNKKNWLGMPVTYTKAVDDVSFEVYENETLGIVGESGCGKTTLGRCLLQLIPAANGNIFYRDKNLALLEKESLRTLRQYLQIIFQDPYSSLNPRKKIGTAIEEPLLVHHMLPDALARKQKVFELLEKVGLQPEHYHRYPHEFSGGQRQRIVIARALALSPSFLICDESVSALDVSVQAQVLNLLNDLKKEFGFTIVFISHDLSVVRYFSDRIIVMNKGKIEEMGQADELYETPRSPYTKKLIDSIPGGVNA